MGEFEEARDAERHVLRELRELLGLHHPDTGRAMYNLAISEALAGDPARALELARARYALRVDLGGEGDATAARTAIAMARYHRELGQLNESFDLLKRVLGHIGSPRAATPARPTLDVLRAESGLAITERRLGAPLDARERDERILADLRAHQGDRNHVTLISMAGLAADLDALGKHEAAVERARSCLAGLRATLGADHPYARVCEVSLGAYLRNSDELVEATETGETALDRLAARLPPAHPWILAAAVALANTMVLRGRLDRAAELEERAWSGFAEAGMPDHPNAKVAAKNLLDTRSRMAGETSYGRAVRSDIDLEIPGL